MVRSIFKDTDEKYLEISQKMKAGPKNRRFCYQITEYDKFLHFRQNIHKCGARWSNIHKNVPHFGEKFQYLVSLLFVGGYLAERPLIGPRNLLL